MVTRRALVLAIGGLATTPWRLRAQDYPFGVFIGSLDGPQELVAHAERTSEGAMRMALGTFDDLPIVRGPMRLICNLPHWRLTAVWLSTRRIFSDAHAERRQLGMSGRPLGVASVFARLPDTERPERLRALVQAVGASADNPAYVFVTMFNEGLARDYVVAIDAAP